jgi:CubicO group peptidase (beta-lactamase class C family)
MIVARCWPAAARIAGALALGTASLGGQQPGRTPVFDAAARNALRAEIQRVVDSAGIASLTVGIARDGAVLWTEGFGYADLARRRRATPSTPYAVASISKPITATAVMRLVEQGRIALDRPIDDYLGGLRLTSRGGDRAAATVRRVLSHTSGLPLHYRFYYLDRTERPDVAQTVARYGNIVFPPGHVYSYSNLGYGLLGDAAARAAGTTYEAYLRDNVFRPLGMRHASVGTGRGMPEAAVRYDGKRRVITPYDFDHRGASAVFASARDLLRFGMFHLDGTASLGGRRRRAPIADSTIRLMQRVATPGDTTAGYGLGWIIDRERGVRRVRHTGSMPGTSAVLAMYPDARVVVVVLSNQYSPLPRQVAARLAAAVVPTGGHDSLPGEGPQPPATAAFSTVAAMRGEWRGAVTTHEGALPFALRVESARILVRLGTAGDWTPVLDPFVRGPLLGGRFAGRIPTADAGRMPHIIGLLLYLQAESFRGWAGAYVDAESDDFALSSYVEAVRTSITTTGQDP